MNKEMLNYIGRDEEKGDILRLLDNSELTEEEKEFILNMFIEEYVDKTLNKSLKDNVEDSLKFVLLNNLNKVFPKSENYKFVDYLKNGKKEETS